MSHTIVELYLKVIPTDLFRLGTKNNPQLDKVRTMPPRTIEQPFDIKTYERNGVVYVSRDSGGVSTFDQKRIGEFWWVIPKGTAIPAGLRVSRDFNPKPGSPTHYTIRPLYDMPLAAFVGLLQELAKSGQRTFEIRQRGAGEVK